MDTAVTPLTPLSVPRLLYLARSDELWVGWINSASPVYAGGAARGSGTAERKVPEQRGAAACLQRSSAFMPVLPRNSHRAGLRDRVVSVCVVATATERRTRHPRRPPRLGGHVAYVARRGRGSVRGAIRELGLVGIKMIWERDFGRVRAAVRETGGADRGSGNACPS